MYPSYDENDNVFSYSYILLYQILLNEKTSKIDVYAEQANLSFFFALLELAYLHFFFFLYIYRMLSLKQSYQRNHLF